MTYGGDLMESGENHPSSKMTNEQVKDIKRLLKETDLTYVDIVKKLNLRVNEHQIYYINIGEQWVDESIQYPIRSNPKSLSKTGKNNPASKLSEENVLEIINLLMNTKLTQQEIANKFGMHRNMIGYINTCKNWTHLHNFKNNIRLESKGGVTGYEDDK
jgi:hypothetical protein